MNRKKDISGGDDIRLLVDGFYEKARKDPALGPIFNDIARVDWEHHLPKMYAFWGNVLLQKGDYSGNPMATHLELNALTPLKKAHFDRWLQLFRETIDENFEGEVAERARQRSLSIATIMQMKIIGDRNSPSVKGI
ncbi:MAG TPA: group III truncated hemoglobin [Puia sp.]|nr:group III truncated hemoglobin [Puia sp.]